MAGMGGWVGGTVEAGTAKTVIHAMAGPLSRFDAASSFLHVGMRHAVAVAGNAGSASIHSEGSLSTVVWGRPNFLGDTFSRIARERGSATALAHLYRDAGAECCTRLTGPFAIAIVDDRCADALLAIDRIGIHSLTYELCGDMLLFASSAAAFRHHPSARALSIDTQSLYNYVHFHMVPGPATIFSGQHRLLPGEYLHYRDGSLQTKRYWTMRFVENEIAPFDTLREELIAKLSGAVGSMSEGAATGAFLSGGTDSSTVSGLLGKVTAQPAETFSIGFSQEGYDEMEFARIAANHFKTSHHEYYVTPADIVDAIPRLAAIYDQPFGNSSAVPTYCCARFARESGRTRILGGDGGDELFGGNARYATQHLLSLYEHVPRALRHHIVEPLARNLPGGGFLPPIRWFRRLIELVATPMPDRLDAHNLLLRLGTANVFSPDFLRGVDAGAPAALMRSVYDDTPAASLINRMLAFDLQFTLADNDLPKVMRSCELAGIEVAFPMLDHDVVEFSARLAPELKLKGTKLRYFFKEALRGFLPDEIITKSKHGFGLPFGPWMKIHAPLEELVVSALTSLKQRAIVREGFIDELLGSHLSRHAGYYGTMAWVLMMLEMWFQAHYDRAS